MAIVDFSELVLTERYDNGEKGDYLTFAAADGSFKLTDPNRLCKEWPVVKTFAAKLDVTFRLYQGSTLLSLRGVKFAPVGGAPK